MIRKLRLRDIIFKTSAINNITIMLLGSAESKSLKHRQTIRDELTKLDFKNIIIMEEIDSEDTDKSLDDKFRRITNEYDPNFFIAIYHNNTKMDGVAFELGWLCCKYNARDLALRLRILSEINYDWKKTTAYINSLFSNVVRNEFDESNEYSKASVCIKNFILNAIGP